MTMIHATPSFALPSVRSAFIPDCQPVPADAPDIQVRVLSTPEERQVIAHLRSYADFRSEYELDPGMAALETVKDSLGIVMGIAVEEQTIATIRFIPTGHGVTLTERFWRDLVTTPAILGSSSWEVGRLVMAPEHRRADLLPRCMALSLVELVRNVEVDYMHASCLVSMTRLYRRFGFGVHALRSKCGKDCALIEASVDKVAACLKVPMPQRPIERAGQRERHEASLLQ